MTVTGNKGVSDQGSALLAVVGSVWRDRESSRAKAGRAGVVGLVLLQEWSASYADCLSNRGFQDSRRQ